MQAKSSYYHLAFILSIWVMRILVGGVFIMSGLTKLIDLWGFVFKIEDYLAVWGWDVPRTLVLVGGLLLSTFEFTAGVLLTTGCYRRTVVWLMMACMAFMLPLTIYIWAVSPVNDCGCFGDFLVISNTMTMIKNFVIVGVLIFLVKYNSCTGCIFRPSVQWAAMTACVIYSFAIGLIGYNIQPLEDFRPFPQGSALVGEVEDCNDETVFIYERDGETREFTIDELPDEESGWVFVDRKDNETSKDHESLTIFSADGEDVTEDILADNDSMLLLVIPEPARADLSYTYIINELSDYLNNEGIETIGLLATDEKGIDRWKDNSMATYECYAVEDTQLKELARGLMSFVWVENDTIKWKRTISSIELEDVSAITKGEQGMNSLLFNGHLLFKNLTGFLVAAFLVILLLQEFGVTLRKQLHRWKNLRIFAKRKQ